MIDEMREKKYSQSINLLEQYKEQQHRDQQIKQNSLSTTHHSTLNYLSTDTFDFEFDMGHESIHNHMTVSIPQHFMGYCYYCDCPQHSQNYCPLRYCYFCEFYGHNSRVCSTKKYYTQKSHYSQAHHTQHSNLTQQYYSHFSHSNNFSKHWKKSRRVFKIPFGSTWKDDAGGIMKNESWRKKDRPVTQILFDFDNK